MKSNDFCRWCTVKYSLVEQADPDNRRGNLRPQMYKATMSSRTWLDTSKLRVEKASQKEYARPFLHVQ